MNRSKREILEIVLGCFGIFYISYTLFGIFTSIGDTTEATELTLGSAIGVVLVLMGWHWSIGWIKDMFRDE